MNNNEVNISKLKLAQLRYFDTKKNGSMIPDLNAYVFLVKINDTYINLFNPLEELPIFDRVPYSNATKDGVEFGTKLFLAQGQLQDGPCYIVDSISINSLFNKEKISLKDIENYILKSNRFFVDRLDLLERRRDVIGAKRRRIVKNDIVKQELLKEYFESQNNNYIYRKV